MLKSNKLSSSYYFLNKTIKNEQYVWKDHGRIISSVGDEITSLGV